MDKTNTKQAHVFANQGTDIMLPITAAEMVEAAQRAERMMSEARALVSDAQAIMRITFNRSTRFEIVSEGDTIKEIKQAAWACLFDAVDFWKTASIALADKYKKMIWNNPDELPALTMDEIYLMFETLRQNRTSHALESILEVYDWLVSRDVSREKLKTNQKLFLSNKVIVEGGYSVMDKRYASLYMREWSGNRFTATDRVFHFLDGNRPFEGDSYRCPLLDAMNSALANRGKDEAPKAYAEGQTDYFRFKVYMNGNVHLTFIRKDLVHRLNAIGGERRLPQNGRD